MLTAAARSRAPRQSASIGLTASPCRNASCGFAPRERRLRFDRRLLQNTRSTEVTDLTVQRCDTSGFYSTARTDAASTGAHVFVTTSAFGGGLRRVNVLDNIMHGGLADQQRLGRRPGFCVRH
jgi:hypothetical protein